MNAIIGMPAPTIFTDNAAIKVAQLIEQEGNADLKLRVFVQGGGCSGFQYGFTFDEVLMKKTRRLLKRRAITHRCNELPVSVGAEIELQG